MQVGTCRSWPAAGIVGVAVRVALCFSVIGWGRAASLAAAEPVVVPLWAEGAPGAVGQAESDRPTLTVSLPSQSSPQNGAVIVCPGGGYGGLALDHEGQQIAAWLNRHGLTALVLRYRHAPHYRHPTPLGDLQRAIRTARARAAEWKFNPQRIAVIGFSAGGHLTSTAATHFDAGQADAADPIDRQSCRPDAVILCYPVISLVEEFSHAGSRRNLLGESPPAELVEFLSNERQVTAQSPPAFLFHTGDDPVVLVDNAVAYYQACHRAGVPAELHVYPHGRHGVGLAADDPSLSSWPELAIRWLRGGGWMP